MLPVVIAVPPMVIAPVVAAVPMVIVVVVPEKLTAPVALNVTA